VGKERLETFADGVFAIAATLLILNVELPNEGGGRSLAHELVHLWPAYAAYTVSFLVIGVIWVNHHTILSLVGRTDRTFLFVNVVFLLAIAFLPFPTRVLADNLRAGDARTAAVFYGLTSIAMSVTFLAVWLYCSRIGRLLSDDADPRVVSGITRSFLPGTPLYVLATLSCLISAWLGAALYAALALFYVVSSTVFGRAE
jgi:uncharacterized membrane protein